jgi:hypothetical protein
LASGSAFELGLPRELMFRQPFPIFLPVRSRCPVSA